MKEDVSSKEKEGSGWFRPRSKEEASGAPSISRGEVHHVGRSNSKLLRIFSILTLVGLGIFALFSYFLNKPAKFPILPAGSYIGVIAEVAGEKSVHFYLEKAPETDEIFVAVLAAGWKPQLVPTFINASAGEAELWSLPLILTSPSTQLELTGEEKADLNFGGIAKDKKRGQRSPWHLEPIRSAPVDLKGEGTDVRQWLMLRAEYGAVEALNQELFRSIPEKRKEIDRLSALLSEGQELRTRANERFAGLIKELEQANKDLMTERLAVRQLEEALSVSQKVTPAGRLVGLSREIHDREIKVLQAMIEAGGGVELQRIEAEFQIAEEALWLQRQLNELRQGMR